MGLFGPSKQEKWEKAADELGANYINNRFFRNSHIEYEYKGHKIYMDVLVTTNGTSDTISSRMRVKFNNKSNLFFRISKKNIFSSINKQLTMKCIDTGFSDIDKNYVVKTDDKDKFMKIIKNEEIRKLIMEQPRFNIYTVNAGGMLYEEKLYQGENILQFRVNGIMGDVEKIKSLFILFTKFVDVLEN